MEDYNFYRDNVATICSHRAEISKSPEQYFAVLPLSLKYVFQSENQVGQICAVRGPIYLGSLIRAWNEYLELFTKECPSERCGSGKAYIYYFNGSPFSGNNEYSCICEDCGARIVGGSDRGKFHKRCEALNKILAEDRDKSLDVHAMSIKEVIQFYKDEKKQLHSKGFHAIADLLFSDEV